VAKKVPRTIAIKWSVLVAVTAPRDTVAWGLTTIN